MQYAVNQIEVVANVVEDSRERNVAWLVLLFGNVGLGIKFTLCERVTELSKRVLVLLDGTKASYRIGIKLVVLRLHEEKQPTEEQRTVVDLQSVNARDGGGKRHIILIL